jgi:hypothetical protein
MHDFLITDAEDNEDGDDDDGGIFFRPKIVVLCWMIAGKWFQPRSDRNLSSDGPIDTLNDILKDAACYGERSTNPIIHEQPESRSCQKNKNYRTPSDAEDETFSAPTTTWYAFSNPALPVFPTVI